MSARTEAPTPRRLEDARKRGQFARAQPVTALAGTVFAVGGLAASLDRARAETLAFAGAAWSLEVQPLQAGLLAGSCLAWWIVPPALGALLGALTAGIAQAGLHPQPALLAPDFSRLAPLDGLLRPFSLERIGTLLRSGAFALVVGWSWTSRARWSLAGLLRVADMDVGAAAAICFEVLLALVFHLLPWSLVWCALEYGLAHHRHLRKLRMTREEVRREYRESEGDPVIKGHRKAMHRALAQGGPARGLGQAHALVVNPTHLAVALRYEPGECEAPYVVARGQEEEALALRLEAQGMGIPVIRDVPLARSLIRLELGEEVPEELYRAAAAVLKVAQEGAVSP